jgi:chromosomal replication initiator protein
MRRLEDELSVGEVNLWLKPLQARESAAEVVVFAPNAHVFEEVRDRYGARVGALIDYFSDGRLELRLVIGVAPNQPGEGAVAAAATVASNAVDPSGADGLDARYRFDNFVVGSSNRVGHAAALNVAEHPGTPSLNPLLMYGGTGLGKTHLLHAIGAQIRQRKRHAKIRYIRTEAFVSGFIHALRHDRIDDFKAGLRSLDLLLVDDVQFLAKKGGSQEEFFHTFNALLDGGQQVVLTCDRYPKEVDGLEPRLKSRFSWGLSVAIEPPDFETRVAILLEKAHSQGIELREDVAALIARKLPGNVRDLEGALNTVIATARFAGQPITVGFTQATLRDLLTVHERLVSVGNIQKVVAEYYQIRPSDLTGAARTQRLARPRQLAMALAKTLTESSLVAIGEEFGGRDHSTVLYACREIEKRKASDGKLKEDWERLVRALTAS